MKKALPLPSQATLKLLFDYDPETGVITRRMNEIRRWNYRQGDIATTLHKPTGYLRVCIGKSIFRANRLIWVWMTGEDPKDLIVDHKDRNRANNRWTNLRLAAFKRKDAEERNLPTNGANRTQYELASIKRSGSDQYTFCPRDGRRESGLTREEAIRRRDAWRASKGFYEG